MPSLSGVDPSQVIALLLALGIGLLIGLERERHKGAGPNRRAAGIRSFALAAASGALAQLLPAPGLMAVGGALVALLAATSHFKSRSGDPGLTTEPLLGTACGVALALLLNTRSRLHHFATQVLTEQELHDGLLLCAAALIVLPLIPDRPLASLATWVLVILIAGTLSTDAALALVRVAGASLGCTMAVCAGLLAWAPTDWVKDRGSPLWQAEIVRTREAVAMGSMLFVITPAVSYAQRQLEQTGLMLSVALAGLAGAHTPVASLATLFGGRQLPRGDLIVAVLLAITANSGTRLVVALVSGRLASGVRVGSALGSGLVGG